MADKNSDCWEAFGADSSSSSEDEDGNSTDDMEVEDMKIKKIIPAIDAASLQLVKLWSSSNNNNNHSIPLTKRYVSYLCSNKSAMNYISNRFNQRGFVAQSIKDGVIENNLCVRMNNNNKDNDNNTSDTSYFDAAVLVIEEFDNDCENKIKVLQESVVPGGYFILFLMSSEAESSIEMYGFSWNVWDINNDQKRQQPNTTVVFEDQDVLVYCIKKRPCLVNVSACPWKYSLSSNNKKSDCLHHEYHVLSDVTVTSPAIEYRNNRTADTLLSPQAITKAVNAIQTYGFCVIKNIFPKNTVKAFGQAAINDMKEAIKTLKNEPHDIDILDPTSSKKSYCSNFREMAMREDLRVDLRDGKQLRKMIELYGEDWIKDHKSIVDILTRVMNPRDDVSQLHHGNFGKWNFENAALGGPDAPPDAPLPGPIGTILTFPKCADQAIHADTSHLFDIIDCHPPHYINLFLPAFVNTSSSSSCYISNNGSNPMGGTAFISKSHVLSTCKSYLENKKQMNYNIIRPSLQIGDAILFDCRALHFGLANNSNITSNTTASSFGENGNTNNASDKANNNHDGWRPVLYVNWMLKWFTDPKNWNNEKRLFLDLDED